MIGSPQFQSVSHPFSEQSRRLRNAFPFIFSSWFKCLFESIRDGNDSFALIAMSVNFIVFQEVSVVDHQSTWIGQTSRRQISPPVQAIHLRSILHVEVGCNGWWREGILWFQNHCFRSSKGRNIEKTGEDENEMRFSQTVFQMTPSWIVKSMY